MRPTFAIRETAILIRQIDLSGVKFQDALGYPRIDWEKYQRQKPPVVARSHRAVILQNRYVRVTVLPEMGRVYSFVFRPTGHEQFWTNSIAKPIPGQQNDTGWWLILGGAEYTIPRGEHGTTWALPWKYRISENSSRRKAVEMRVLEPQTKIEQTLEIALFQDRAYYEAEITLKNTGDQEARFSHWVNPMWAPGGRGQLTPDTELIVPCTAMIVLDRDFNRWMLGSTVQEYERNPLRFVKHWRSIGDLLAQQLTAGFYAAFSHEANEGVVRIFDPKDTPGMDIWTWGFPPPPERQREYSEVPNLGYVEMWGGTSRNFSDEARGALGAGMHRRWKEQMYAFHNTGGLTYANQDIALNFKSDQQKKLVDLGLFVTRARRGVLVELRQGDGVLLRRRLNLSPDRPFRARISAAKSQGSAQAVPRLILTHNRQVLANVEAKLSQPMRWDFPYLPAEATKQKETR
ncbi:MAG: DUF5107 domain-containing protein [Verrucomicrobia bacterium]|nr:DUF5107 domain-containing protein [Verrucomicrobiota bacterium]